MCKEPIERPDIDSSRPGAGPGIMEYTSRLQWGASPLRVLRVRPAWIAVALGVSIFAAVTSATAQNPNVHHLHSHTTPPGATAAFNLQRPYAAPGHVQAVEIKAPAGATVALAADGQFTELEAAPIRVGLMMGPVYRLKVGNIPFHEGREVFPTVEMIGRTCPPPGLELVFPVPIDLTQEDLELALSGKFVTRVVYLEEPRAAMPVAETRDTGRWFDAGPNANPIEVADVLGRPLAIVRIGGRIPDDSRGPDLAFFGMSAPFVKYPSRPPQQIPVPVVPVPVPVPVVVPEGPAAPNAVPVAPGEGNTTSVPPPGRYGQRPPTVENPRR